MQNKKNQQFSKFFIKDKKLKYYPHQKGNSILDELNLLSTTDN